MRAWDRDIDVDFSGVLLDEKLYKAKNENILIYDILWHLIYDISKFHWVQNHLVLGTTK